METIYDIGDKVTLIAVVKGIQMNGDNKCPLYTLRVPSTSGYNNDVYLSEMEIDKMNSKTEAELKAEAGETM